MKSQEVVNLKKDFLYLIYGKRCFIQPVLVCQRLTALWSIVFRASKRPEQSLRQDYNGEKKEEAAITLYGRRTVSE